MGLSLGERLLFSLSIRSWVSLLVASDDESLLEEDSEDEDEEDDEDDGVEEIEIVSLGAGSFTKTISSSVSSVSISSFSWKVTAGFFAGVRSGVVLSVRSSW